MLKNRFRNTGSRMAAADVLPLNCFSPREEDVHQSLTGAIAPHTDSQPLPEPSPPDSSASMQMMEDFDPKTHLGFTPPSRIYSMKDLDLAEDTGVSPVAVSEPFPLFTQQAIDCMRSEVMSRSVWDNCQYSSNLAKCQLRGFAPKFVSRVEPCLARGETG